MTTEANPAVAAHRRRQILTGSVGHLVEYFDWSAYSFLAIYFSRQFFPGDAGSVVPLLSTFVVFALGFLTRPIGGVLMGRMADRYGRRLALTVGVGMMGVGSLMIGLAPTYAQVGILAPIILVVARLIQGLSTGGELAAASAFLMESAPAHRRGVYTSLTNISSSLGKVLCLVLITVLVNAVGSDAMAEWAWRVPFLLGAVAALVAWWIRRRAEETYRADGASSAGPAFRELVTEHRPALWRAFVLASVTAAMFYTWSTYAPTWAVITEGLDKRQAVTISAIAFVVYGLVQLPLGQLSDRIGRRPMMFAFYAGNIVFTVPLFAAMSANPTTMLLVQCAGMLLSAILMSVAAAMLGEMFPARIRVLATGAAFSVATALFGGTVPAIGTAIHEAGADVAFPIYLVVLNVIALALTIRLPETAHAPLPK
ncbi:Major facilitator superfamily MFS_1 OS=Tsukamurella paurometabola (strain ATCC 8368 / DSM /CCUG 35730 / CIP 100753 / JCM 10117 / KCTC 9821 / NBRC 16120/ NCIMB 702349 / NCTC 13040) OX=521096 GN=Tpau_1649 PE=3 SV=1 [Tsukamurella paurometabola]|uniref:Major facilitator superfamily MFS_1 n=1 Tax=Tsukamurella paurometabola (strain ATCC 8368 / DSM 20162 / CCUG 35730 / CIP 100753 / JCM 10117 / KCTC 9821 / NBRC 16120 / NCIMB 702349 / NCTC 13040) TaxID=521096 RepID=D5UYG3_TSUPD|nr:MFS transporter [Tsukamurella paurometabola]ADG78270.1 major facilitator superfamily MFS_1 [Tsukamurella paurometabola DSM 20162]SUP30955.1 Alpha-ketoglutarate permease [Tsukamurella paurometabola]